MTGKRADTLLQLMHRIEYFTLQRASDGLTDEEFFWEPTPRAWSVRRREECQTPNPFGAGAWVADFEQPEPSPPPLTTIGWLFWHIGSMPGRLADIEFLGGDRTMPSGWTSPYLTHHPVFSTAAEAVSALCDGWATLRGVIEQASDDDLETLTARYTYADAPMTDGVCVLGEPGPQHSATFFVAGTLNEVSHHATQICNPARSLRSAALRSTRSFHVVCDNARPYEGPSVITLAGRSRGAALMIADQCMRVLHRHALQGRTRRR
jgi:hypothetical protein